MDEHALGFGQHEILGCPYHGLVVGNRLTLPNGQHIDNQWNTFQVRGAYRIAVPGVPAITRTPEQAAVDAASGYLWRTDSVVWLLANGPFQTLYGRKLVNTSGFYAAAPGQCWTITMPFMPVADEGFTELSAPASMSEFGRIGVAADSRSVPIALAGYGDGRVPPQVFRTLDCAGAGNRILLGDSLLYDAAHEMHVQAGGRMAVLVCTGTGTEANPLHLTLEFVADQGSAAQTISDGFVLFDGVFEWQPEITIEWIPPKEPQDDDCQWMRQRTSGYDLVYLPKNPEIPDPFNWVRYITGTRTASLTDHVLGGWLDDVGEPVLVTCDIEYSFEATHSMDCHRPATPDEEKVFRYYEQFGVCGLDGNWSDDQYNVEGVFSASGTYGASTTERITFALKVDGTAVDEYVLEHLFVESVVLFGTVAPEDSINTNGALTRTYTLKLNDEVVDEHVVSVPDGPDTPAFSRNLLVAPLLDVSARFGIEPLEQWLPAAAVATHRLRDIAEGQAVQVAPHWWSNTMVCLATRLRPWPFTAGGGTRKYGPTAHPGGVEAGSITVTAPSSTVPPPPRFGARSSLTGAVTVGHAQRIQYV